VDHPDIDSLLCHENWMVRADLATDPSLSVDQIFRLMTDPNETVRAMTANWRRDVPEHVILRAIHEFPQDTPLYAFHAEAPGIALGFRGLSWVGQPNLERYLDYQNATNTQRGRMYEMWAASGGGPSTLRELWSKALETP
jgi:hypothetical protein